MKSIAVLVALPAFCLLAQAQQDVTFSGPISGWAVDPPTHSIRLITGMPGAALLGRQVLSDLTWASTAPGNSMTAIAIRNRPEDTAEAVLLHGDNVSRIEGAAIADAPQFAVWSPDAKAVVLIWAESRTAQIVRILPDENKATAAEPFSFSNLPETGTITAAAIGSSSAESLYLAVSDSGIYKVANTSESEGQEKFASLVLATLSCQALVADIEGGKLWVVDQSANTLHEVAIASNETSIFSLDTDILSGVSAVWPAARQNVLYLANGATRKIHRVDLASHAVTEAASELDSVATMLTPLARPSVFLLGIRGSAEEPLYLWDEVSGKVYFVPQGGDGQ